MKVLILSCNTGGGHNSAAKAIKEIFDNYYECCYDNSAAAAILDMIFIILEFEGDET